MKSNTTGRIEVNVEVRGETVIMKVIEFPDHLRCGPWEDSDIKIFNKKSSGYIQLKSCNSPELCNDAVYLCGWLDKYDDNIEQRSFSSRAEAHEYAARLLRSIDEYNQNPIPSTEKTITVGGREYSESTLIAALRAYVS